MPLQPHSRSTSGAATTAAAIAASRRPVRRRGVAGTAGTCSPAAGHEARGAASFRSSPEGDSRGATSWAPPAAGASSRLRSRGLRRTQTPPRLPAPAAPPRHGPPLPAAADEAGATQERPTGEDPEPGVRGGPGATGGSEARPDPSRARYHHVGWAESNHSGQMPSSRQQKGPWARAANGGAERELRTC